MTDTTKCFLCQEKPMAEGGLYCEECRKLVEAGIKDGW